MNATRRTLIATLITLLCAPPLWAAQTATVPKAPSLTQEEMSAFLRKASIGNQRSAGGGVTNSKRATLTDGAFSHDAHIQTVDVAMAVFQSGRSSEVNFKDSYRFNIAGYRLASLLAIRVPVSVERTVDGASASVTWWVDDVAMDEQGRTKKKTAGPDPVRTTQQLTVMRVWDELIQNRDRNQGNILWTSDWTLWLIDHTRAFRIGHELQAPDKLTRCDRGLLVRLRALTADEVRTAVGSSLTKDELVALMARRDAIVTRLDARIALVGEAAVLFSINP